MEKKLYFECYSGISGDMAVAALLDLGADERVLMDVLKSLPLDGFEVKISRVKKSGLDACDFDVILEKEQENHDHDMEYLYGKHYEGEGHMHGDCPTPHAHGEHTHHHMHRGLSEIVAIIQASAASERAKELAIRIFEILAEAEAKAHGVPLPEVHFHEVGAVDSIVDIVAFAVCIDNLGITQAAASELYEGKGFVRCQHGIIPVPVPAVVNIAAAHGLRIHLTDDEGEFVTPTGAAVLAALKTQDLPPQNFEIEKVGLGAGKRKHNRSGILRAMLVCESV